MLNSESITNYKKTSIVLSVRFLFVGEGSSDNELTNHLERCCILAGADEASGVAPDLSRLPQHVGHTVTAKLKVALRLEPTVDFVFLHRDADSQDSEPRYHEIHHAVAEVSPTLRYVAVVPVQETEAWLMLDEDEIRMVAENPSGSVLLSIPTPKAIEGIANPKERFADTILQASEQTGRRRDRVRRKLPQKRSLLIRRLDPEGLVSGAPSWMRMFSDLETLIDQVE